MTFTIQKYSFSHALCLKSEKIREDIIFIFISNIYPKFFNLSTSSVASASSTREFFVPNILMWYLSPPQPADVILEHHHIFWCNTWNPLPAADTMASTGPLLFTRDIRDNIHRDSPQVCNNNILLSNSSLRPRTRTWLYFLLGWQSQSQWQPSPKFLESNSTRG